MATSAVNANIATVNKLLSSGLFIVNYCSGGRACVLDCGSPLPLSTSWCDPKRQRTAAVQDAGATSSASLGLDRTGDGEGVAARADLHRDTSFFHPAKLDAFGACQRLAALAHLGGVLRRQDHRSRGVGRDGNVQSEPAFLGFPISYDHPVDAPVARPRRGQIGRAHV